MIEPIIDPNAAEVIAKSLAGFLWPQMVADAQDVFRADAARVLAALSARGLSVVQLEQPTSGDCFAIHKPREHVDQLFWGQTLMPDESPLYRVIPVGEKP